MESSTVGPPGGRGPVFGGADNTIAADSTVKQRLWLARVCLLLALCGAGYLATVSLTGGAPAGCGPGSGCDRVLSSRWAYWLGFPVSLPACAAYVCLFAATLTLRKTGSLKMQRRSWQGIVALSALVLGAALWFFLVQWFVLNDWCKFCLATHASAAGAACLLLWATRRSWRGLTGSNSVLLNRRDVFLSLCIAVLGLTLLVAGQVAVKKRLYVLSPLSGHLFSASGQVSLHHGRFKFDLDELPHLGSSSATNFIVSLFDYTCSHCRVLHPLLRVAEQRYSGQLCIISLPTPLDSDCNPLILLTSHANANACEYARLGLAVWRARREALREFDDWLFASASPPPLDQARAKAEELIGKLALDRALGDRWVARQLQADVALYEANARAIGDARLPQIVVGDVVMHGAVDSVQDLLHLLEQHMRLRSVAAAATNDSPSGGSKANPYE